MAQTDTVDEIEVSTLDLLLDAQDCLKAIDLRTLPREGKQPVKDAREAVKTAIKAVK